MTARGGVVGNPITQELTRYSLDKVETVQLAKDIFLAYVSSTGDIPNMEDCIREAEVAREALRKYIRKE